jgi:hypothetical protein
MKPTRAQLKERERRDGHELTRAFDHLIATGRIVDNGKRRWSEATGRDEIVYVAPEFLVKH